ncbi:MAG: exodeoxyribonuclease VII large subunit [Terrimicrobiaceae bacterium]|nr:exodeoxyribonuclease VII large subunit [Terrimicrobiaceae bacterium]
MQLDLTFGERPDPPESAPRVLSVSEVTRAVRAALEKGIGEVWVRGEISNHRRQASGHQYFTLKDEGSQLACVLFAGAARSLRGLRLTDGMQVQVFGELTVYEARGQYQLVVQLAQEEGLGALRARFEALKARLAAEGLFDADRKRPLPRFPARIGVVTSPTGAAIRDFLKVLHRRAPGVEVLIHPVRVQGRGAAAEIAAAIADLSAAPENGLPAVDVVVVTRGGGSLEDLWEFNEEAVARAIAASRVPVVSAVGHEIDFTLADFAADLRAPTPSAAAELIVPDAAEVLRGVRERVARMLRECAGAIRFRRSRLAAHERSALFREPARTVRERRQQLDALDAAMRRSVESSLKSHRDSLRRAAVAVAAQSPVPRLASLRDRLSRVRADLAESTGRRLTRQRERLGGAAALLQTLSPLATLARGYSITFDSRGVVVRSIRGLEPGEAILTRLSDGEVESVVAKSN